MDFFIPYVSLLVLGTTGTEMGLIYSIQTAAHAGSSFLAGYLADRMSKRKLVLFGAIGRGSAYFVLYIVVILRSYAGVIIAQSILGFTVSFFWVPISTLLSEKSAKTCRSLAFGKRQYSKGIGILIGTTIGVSLFVVSNTFFPGNPFLPHAGLLLFGAANIVAGISFYKKVDESITFDGKHAKPSSPETIAKVSDQSRMKNSLAMAFGMLFLLMAFFFTSMNESITKPYLRWYLLDTIGVNENMAILGFIPASMVSLFLAPKLGRIADRMHPMAGMALFCSCGAAITAIIVNVNDFWSFTGLLVFDSTFAIATGLVIENVVSRVTIAHRGKMFGLKATLGNCGEVVAPILGGVMWDIFPRLPFIISIFIELSLIFVYLLAWYNLKKHFSESFDLRVTILPPKDP